jgi:hypothetical protein
LLLFDGAEAVLKFLDFLPFPGKLQDASLDVQGLDGDASTPRIVDAY